MLESGKVYTDRSGKTLPEMNTSGVPGQFWCAVLGDGRYFAEDGTCLRMFGTDHGGANLSPAPEHGIQVDAA